MFKVWLELNSSISANFGQNCDIGSIEARLSKWRRDYQCFSTQHDFQPMSGAPQLSLFLQDCGQNSSWFSSWSSPNKSKPGLEGGSLPTFQMFPQDPNMLSRIQTPGTLADVTVISQIWTKHCIFWVTIFSLDRSDFCDIEIFPKLSFERSWPKSWRERGKPSSWPLGTR